MQPLIAFCQRFATERVCAEHLEEMRWPEGPMCLRCGSTRIYSCASRRIFKCGHCQQQFTVRIGTMFERSHIPLRKWYVAIYLLAEQKQVASSIQIAKRLDITQKSAWYMVQRVRYALAGQPGAITPPPALDIDIPFDELMTRLIKPADRELYR